MKYAIGILSLLAASPTLAQTTQQQDDRVVRATVQSLSQAQQMLLGLPEMIAENQRLQAENKALKQKLDEAAKSPPSEPPKP